MAPVRSAIVIGGGPAGSVAATLLARGGAEVTLIEQSSAPRDKVCGECLSDLGLRTLEHHDLLGPLTDLSPRRLTRARFVAAGGAELSVNLPAAMAGLSRRVMDQALLEAAQAAGASIWRPAKARVLEPGDRPVVEIHDLGRNTTERRAADVVVVADGRGVLSLGPPSVKPPATGDLGLKAHFENVAADPAAIALFGLRGHYAGLAAVSDGAGTVWNLACNVPAARVRAAGGDHERLLAQMRSENAALDHALSPSRRVGPWLACPLPRFAVLRDWPAGVVPVGNAAAALEPIGGEGMGLAIASAALAARFLLAHGPRETAELRRAFAKLWRMRRMACRATALLLSRPRMAGWTVRLARAAPPLVGLAVGLAGKNTGRRALSGVSSPAPGALSWSS